MENNELLEEAKKYGEIRDGKVYLKPFMDYPERQVGEVKDKDDEALEYFARRFETFAEKVDVLLKKLEEAENKGSFLMKVLHMKEQIGSYEAIGDFTALHRLLSNAENEIKAIISRNREKNLEVKIAIITEAEELQNSHDWQAATDRFKELRQNWIKTGPIEKGLSDEVEERFRTATDKFFERKKEFFNDKQQMQKQAIDRYRALIKESEEQKKAEDWQAATRRMKELQEEWKTVGGNLPRKLSTDLWNSFRKVHNEFFEGLKDKMNSQKAESREKFLEDNLGKKTALVEEAETLMNKPLPEAIAHAKQLQAEWKKVGPVKQPESDQIWERFMKACDKVFELSNADYVLRKKQVINENSNQQQINQARINILNDFIKGDRQELEVLDTNLGKLADIPNNIAFREMLQNKIRSFKRRISTKQELISYLKDKPTATEKTES